MLLYTLILHWFASEGYRHEATPLRPWYPQRTRASFADMLLTLRRKAPANRLFL